jgi:ribokinase
MTEFVSNVGEERVTQALVVANATVDETYAVAATPRAGESLIGQFRSRDVGGKGANVATIMARCGVATQLMAGIGNDERGKFVHRELSKENMTLTLFASTHHPTDISIIYTDDQGENSIVTTVAATQDIDYSLADRVMQGMRKPGFVVLQGNLSQETTLILIDHASRLGLTIVFNPSPCTDWITANLPCADILILNEVEAEALTGLKDAAAVESLLRHDIGQVVLTRGSKGALLGMFDVAGSTAERCSIQKVAAAPAVVVDTTGAGDLYLGVALASSIVRGTVIDTLALHHAARAASIAISRFGTRRAFPDTETLASILAQRFG